MQKAEQARQETERILREQQVGGWGDLPAMFATSHTCCLWVYCGCR